jgi:hypothetical protein
MNSRDVKQYLAMHIVTDSNLEPNHLEDATVLQPAANKIQMESEEEMQNTMNLDFLQLQPVMFQNKRCKKTMNLEFL